MDTHIHTYLERVHDVERRAAVQARGDAIQQEHRLRPAHHLAQGDAPALAPADPPDVVVAHYGVLRVLEPKAPHHHLHLGGGGAAGREERRGGGGLAGEPAARHACLLCGESEKWLPLFLVIRCGGKLSVDWPRLHGAGVKETKRAHRQEGRHEELM